MQTPFSLRSFRPLGQAPNTGHLANGCSAPQAADLAHDRRPQTVALKNTADRRYKTDRPLAFKLRALIHKKRNVRFARTAAARASSTDSGTHRPDTPTLSLRTRVRGRRRRSCPQSGGRTGNEHRYAGRVNLAWKLALVCRGECAEALLNSFSIERSAIGDQVLKVAGRMTMVATVLLPQVILEMPVTAITVSHFRGAVHYENRNMISSISGRRNSATQAARTAIVLQIIGRQMIMTERLHLRSFTPADARLVECLAGDKAVASMTSNIPHPYPPGLAAEWIAQTQMAIAKGLLMQSAIVAKASGILMGCVSLQRQEGLSLGEGELAYWLGAPYWGCGFATEACRAFVSHVSLEWSLSVVRAGALSENCRSVRVLQKLGMTPDGEYEIPWRGQKDPVQILGFSLRNG